MDANTLKSVVSHYFLDKRQAVNFEIGVKEGLRADVLSVSMRSKITMIETKSSVQDFRTDKKWQRYLKYCHQFYFAVDVATYKKIKDDIPKGIGVFVVSDRLGIKIFQKASNREVDPKLLLDTVTRLAFRSADKNRHIHKSKLTVHKTIIAEVLKHDTDRARLDALQKLI